MDTIQGKVEQRTNGLELLFSLELHYQGPIEFAPIGDKVGTLVGGGDGTLTGPLLRGTVRWSIYETTGRDQVCALQVPGFIQTHDGALIQFEGRELAMPLSDGSKQCRVAGVLLPHATGGDSMADGMTALPTWSPYLAYGAILALLGAQVWDLWLYRRCAPKAVPVPTHSAPASPERRKEGV